MIFLIGLIAGLLLGFWIGALRAEDYYMSQRFKNKQAFYDHS